MTVTPKIEYRIVERVINGKKVLVKEPVAVAEDGGETVPAEKISTKEQQELERRWEAVAEREEELEKLADQLGVKEVEEEPARPVYVKRRTWVAKTEKKLLKNNLDIVVVYDATWSRSSTLQASILSLIEAHQAQKKEMIKQKIGRPKLRLKFIFHNGNGVPFDAESSWMHKISELKQYAEDVNKNTVPGGTHWTEAVTKANEITSDALMLVGDNCEDFNFQALRGVLHANFDKNAKNKRPIYALWDSQGHWNQPEMGVIRDAIAAGKRALGMGRHFILNSGRVDLKELIQSLFKTITTMVPKDEIVRVDPPDNKLAA